MDVIKYQVTSVNTNASNQIAMAFNRRDREQTIDELMDNIAKELGYNVIKQDEVYNFVDRN